MFFLAALLGLLAGGVFAQEDETPSCATPLPSWTIKDIKIKTRDAVGNGGSASFTLIPNSATGEKPEQLTCARLQGNYRCAVKSKVDPGVEVDLQINMGVVHMSVTQVDFSCGSDIRSIGGSVDIDLACTEPAGAGGDISCESVEDGVIQAVLL